MQVFKNMVEDGETTFHFAEQLLKLVDEFEVDVESELCNSSFVPLGYAAFMKKVINFSLNLLAMTVKSK